MTDMQKDGVDISEVTVSPEGEVVGLDEATLDEIAGGVHGAEDTLANNCGSGNCGCSVKQA